MISIKREIKNNDEIKIIPIGGVEEIGNNSTLIESKDEIIMIDCGLGFPNENMYGIDITLPDLSYIFKNKKKLKAIICTHGHFDHIGAIPYFYTKMDNPLIYAPQLTAELIKSICNEKKINPKIQLLDIESNIIKFKDFIVTPIRIQHSIPDSIALYIQTNHGNIFFATDFKIDNTPTDGIYTDFDKIFKLKSKYGINVAMLESTGIEGQGHSPSESIVAQNLEQIFKNSKGRIIITMFASHLSRVQHVIQSASKLGKKIFISGRSLEKNIEIFAKIGRLNIEKNIICKLSEINKYNPKDCIILVTGSQGQEYSAAYRLAENTHKDIQIQKDDTVIFSSSEIPGNESAISRIKDKLILQGARLIYEKQQGVHASGHGHQEDLLYMLKILNTNYFIPIHGALHMRAAFKELVIKNNILDNDKILLPQNGQMCILKNKKLYLADEKLSNKVILVDGYGVGDVGKKILSERQMIAESGILFVILLINTQTKNIFIDLVSKGLVFQHSIKGFVNELKDTILKISYTYFVNQDKEEIKHNIIKKLSKLFQKKMNRNPLITPYIIINNDIIKNIKQITQQNKNNNLKHKKINKKLKHQNKIIKNKSDEILNTFDDKLNNLLNI